MKIVRMTDEMIQANIALIDVAVKAIGLQGAQNAMVLVSLFQNAEEEGPSTFTGNVGLDIEGVDDESDE